MNQKRKFEKYGVDTLKLCRYLMPGEEKKNLSAACAYFEVTQDTAHRHFPMPMPPTIYTMN